MTALSSFRNLVAVNRRACYRLVARFPGFFSSPSYHEEILGRIRSDLEAGLRHILEAGGNDRPMLSRGDGLRIDGLDIANSPACAAVYDDFLVQSIESPIPKRYEQIISMTLLEHVPDNRSSIREIFAALVPGGRTHHYIPSKGHPYAIVLRLVGPRLQKKLISLLRTDADASVSGFPTFFDHCSVPEMRRLFVASGFTDVRVQPFYRANDYFAFFVPAFVLVTAFENLARTLGWTYFASGFVISATRRSDR